MNEMIFSWAENANGRMVHVDDVPNGLNCGCSCPCCHERLQARHGEVRAHGFAHHSDNRGANLKICYMVIMYKLAEQIIQYEKKIRVPSYYGIFKGGDLVFSEVTLDSQYDREDKQPDVIAITPEGERYLIEFTFDYKVQHKENIDYKNLNCIEIDLSSQTLETLRDFLLNSDKDRKWLNNQTYFESIESLYSKHGKTVKIINEVDCLKCSIKKNCCGIRLKPGLTPIIIENSGETYRVCKTVEYEISQKRANNQFEDMKYYDSDWEQFVNEERQSFYGPNGFRRKETAYEEVIRPGELSDRIREQAELEEVETAKIPTEQRNCFMCRSNLDWMCRGNNYAHCGPYVTMGVPKNTPPDSAKTCRGFRVKVNRK